MLERVYKASALNVAVQDGAEAGQSVSHVHVHLLPRRAGDGNGDEIYERMDGEDGDVGQAWMDFERLRKVRQGRSVGAFEGEEGRRDRSEREMEQEAEMLRWEMEREREIDEMRNGEKGDGSGQFP